MVVGVLAAAVTGLSGSCPLERASYQLRDDPRVTARFEARTPTPDWVSKVQLSIHSAKTAATYFFLPYSGNGQGVTTHLASVQDPNNPPGPDSAKGRPLGDLDYLVADRTYRFEQNFHAESGEPAPAHLLIPGLQESLWYKGIPREGVALGFFDLVGCRRRKAR